MRRGVALAVTVALAAGACGADGASTSPAASPSTATTTVGEGVLAEVFAGFEPDEPGCSASVAVDGELVAAGGFGTADVATGDPLSAESVFDLASVSKQFTAAAVHLLVLDGVVSLDDDVRDHVPELPEYGGTVTLDDLVHHTSGIADYTELLGADVTDVTTDADALDVLASEPELAFEPGDDFEYSNSNYFLLGVVVARVSGQTLGEFLAESVFEPLGMEATVARDRAGLEVPDGVEGHVATGADDFTDHFTDGTTNWEQVGDGAIWSSVLDLQRWAENLATWQVGGEDLAEAMLAPGPVPDGDAEYGGGLVVEPDGTLEHSGSWGGFGSEFVVDPVGDTAVVVLCNRDDVDPVGLADDVIAALDEQAS